MTLVCGAHLEPCCNSPGPLHTVFTVLQVSHQTPVVETSEPLNIMATHYISHHMYVYNFHGGLPVMKPYLTVVYLALSQSLHDTSCWEKRVLACWMMVIGRTF